MDSIVEQLRSFGIEDFNHSRQGLLDHLMGTQAILQRWGAAEYLCTAGLCHSIYGTESFKPMPVSIDNRSKVSAVIGPAAERLVYLFCAHVKNSLWANLQQGAPFSLHDRFTEQDVEISEQEFRDMIELTLANWLEQRPRARESHKMLRQEEFKSARYLLSPAAYEEFCIAYGLAAS